MSNKNKTTVIGRLSGITLGEEHAGVDQTISAVVNEPLAGFLRQARLGPEGLQLQCFGSAPDDPEPRAHFIIIPLPELFLFAERKNPAFRPAHVEAVKSGSAEVAPVDPVSAGAALPKADSAP